MKPRSNLPPSISIVLSPEASPRVLSDAQSDAESNRLADWILSQPDLVELLDRALLIREEQLRKDAA